MTEEEAKQKWCPMVRVYGENLDTRMAELDDDALKDISAGNIQRVSKCIGSACMMFRAHRFPMPLVVQSPTAKLAGMTEFETMTEYYCGLAGKP